MALEVERVLAEEAKERQGERNDLKVVENSNIVEKIPQSEPESKSREKAASIIGNTNARYVQDAKKIEREAPEVKERVLAEEAKERQALNAVINQPQNKSLNMEKIPDSEKGESRDKAASIIGNTNARYVQDAKKIEREAPEVKERVLAEEAKERQLANLKQYSEPNTVVEKIPQREPEEKSREKAASIKRPNAFFTTADAALNMI